TSEILSRATNGVLSLADSDGEPYGVPLSFACDGEGHIYFHSARQGHKIECVAAESRCSFCVVDRDEVVPAEFTTYFRSVIARGRIGIVSSHNEILKGLHLLCSKYSPDIDPEAEIAGCLGRVVVLRLDIESITGKEAIELVKRK
ncbi:MAG: pyridoxamine 5'-phosphate oxidase family protein, partial [Muribaculaceae bacterium]|nr:pyridoxamine 5'-phosphate oxidase family protein [Muribaculaceae bacterium]